MRILITKQTINDIKISNTIRNVELYLTAIQKI